jgi:PTH1 family peptidyl-tRNA hydrolase
MIELAAFLGNPGKEYSRNRHNAGFLLAEKLKFNANLAWQKKFKGSYAALERNRLTEYLPCESGSAGNGSSVGDGGHVGTGGSGLPSRVHFIKPLTFMNLSGECVSQAASFFKIKTGAILVVHDELELPLGTVSLKFGGGLGGHNGLRSMKASFGNADFWRIRIGIGRPDNRLPGEGGPAGSGEGIVDWVLSNFGAVEENTLNKVLETGAELLLRTLANDPGNLLPEWAKKKLPELNEFNT